MKQQFAIARLLLFEGLVDPAKIEQADELTTYFDLNDESVYGLRSGKIKTAYGATFNLFDKIGFFLNDYLQLGIPDRDISFKGIWKDQKKRMRPEICLVRTFIYVLFMKFQRNCPLSSTSEYSQRSETFNSQILCVAHKKRRLEECSRW